MKARLTAEPRNVLAPSHQRLIELHRNGHKMGRKGQWLCPERAQDVTKVLDGPVGYLGVTRVNLHEVWAGNWYETGFCCSFFLPIPAKASQAPRFG